MRNEPSRGGEVQLLAILSGFASKDDQGVCGGLFVDRKHALRFAMLENGSRPQAVMMVPGIFELDISHGGTTAYDNTNVPSQRKVA